MEPLEISQEEFKEYGNPIFVSVDISEIIDGILHENLGEFQLKIIYPQDLTITFKVKLTNYNAIFVEEKDMPSFIVAYGD